jgi:parallel beta-helix repeat protein
VLENNRVHGNADEGIHIGTGSYKNRFAGNTSADNYRENLYLLLANGNVFVRNTLGPGGDE